MISKKKNWFTAGNDEDERIVAGRRSAGNSGFIVVMFLLWLMMVIGLVMNRMDIALVSFAIFMPGCIAYLVAIVRNGAFETARNPGRIRRSVAYVASGVIYSIVLFLFKAKGINDTQGFFNAGIYAVVSAVIWTMLYIGGKKLLGRMNDKTIEKKL